RSALSVHADRGSLAVLDASVFTEPKTSQAMDILDEWSREGRVLVLLGSEEHAAGKSFRNIAGIGVLPVEDAGVTDIIGAASLLISEQALDSLTARAKAKEAEA